MASGWVVFEGNSACCCQAPTPATTPICHVRALGLGAVGVTVCGWLSTLGARCKAGWAALSDIPVSLPKTGMPVPGVGAAVVLASVGAEAALPLFCASVTDDDCAPVLVPSALPLPVPEPAPLPLGALLPVEVDGPSASAWAATLGVAAPRPALGWGDGAASWLGLRCVVRRSVRVLRRATMPRMPPKPDSPGPGVPAAAAPDCPKVPAGELIPWLKPSAWPWRLLGALLPEACATCRDALRSVTKSWASGTCLPAKGRAVALGCRRDAIGVLLVCAGTFAFGLDGTPAVCLPALGAIKLSAACRGDGRSARPGGVVASSGATVDTFFHCHRASGSATSKPANSQKPRGRQRRGRASRCCSNWCQAPAGLGSACRASLSAKKPAPTVAWLGLGSGKMSSVITD